MKGELKPVLDEDGYAFMIGPLDGPHSMIWRLWADKKSNVYLTPRQQPGPNLFFKMTFHTPTTRWPLGARNESITKEYFTANFPDLPLGLRHQRTWEGNIAISPNFQHAYRLFFPRRPFRDRALSAGPRRRIWYIDELWPDPAAPDLCFGLDLIFQTAGKPRAQGIWQRLIYPMQCREFSTPGDYLMVESSTW